jgi:hypothetical protein
LASVGRCTAVCRFGDGTREQAVTMPNEGADAHPRPLHLLTTEGVLAELVSGRGVDAGDADPFMLPPDARAVLDWYRRNGPKWTGSLGGTDAEAIVDALGKTPPDIPGTIAGVRGTGAKLRLKRLTAYHFAGLQASSIDDVAPERFVFEPSSTLTLFEGWNGSGKTSIANAIVWCLTGEILRPQRMPESGSTEFDCEVDRETGPTSHGMSAVTPLPTTVPAGAKAVPCDTWVELLLMAEDGTEVGPIRRSQTRDARSRLVETAPDLAAVGIDAMAVRLGTTMPGMLAYLQVGSASELGSAVAKLTGLAGLVDLGRHASRARERIGKRMVKEIDGQIEDIDRRYADQRKDLIDRNLEFPAMAPEAIVPPADVARLEDMDRLRDHYQKAKAEGLNDARDVLGAAFDSDVEASRHSLEESLAPAEATLKLKDLRSLNRLSALKMDDGDLDAASRLVADLLEEAHALAELQKDLERTRRLQLYARVGSWMHEHGLESDETCVVCSGDLRTVTDDVTGVRVATHLREARDGADMMGKSVARWASDWTAVLARDLAGALHAESVRDLPALPHDLLRSALQDEVFESEGFTGVLVALRAGVVASVGRHLVDVPTFDEPVPSRLPDAIAVQTADLGRLIGRLERAIAFARWSTRNRLAIRDFIVAVRDGVDGRPDQADAIRPRLRRLSTIVNGVAPITHALLLVDRLRELLVARGRRWDRRAECVRTAGGLAAIEPIGQLAQAQVDGLRTRLHARSEYWRDRIYQGATSFAPVLRETAMDARGIIAIKVGRGSVQAPAQHITNASALRASLLAFFLAFREHVLNANGGLQLLILDDPQDLLDGDNRQRLARAIAQIANGAQLIATTHDRAFARTIVQEGRREGLVQHRSVHPVNGSRRTLRTSLAIEDLDRKRDAFETGIDSAIAAQDYVNEARIFLEARIGDLFDGPAHPAYSSPSTHSSLFALMDRMRAFVTLRANELARSPVLARLCDDRALKPEHEARRVLNASHHDKGSISYADVMRIAEDLKRLRTAAEAVHEEYRRFRWREPLETDGAGVNVVRLKPVEVIAFDIPLCADIAAFSSAAAQGGSQVAYEDRVTGGWFDAKALFHIRYDTLGFAVPSGSIAVVETEAASCRDHNLVVARWGKSVFARRLLKPKNCDGISLAAEMPDPRQSRGGDGG